MPYRMALVFVLISLILRTTNGSVSVANHRRWCIDKCLTRQQSRNDIDIYFEYKKAVLRVPDEGDDETETSATHNALPDVSMRDYKVDPVQEKCSSAKFSRTRKKISCKPRPYVLDVVSSKGLVSPDKILTRQCSGYCADSRRVCTPVKSTNVSSYVQVTLEDGRTQCATVLVPQDVKCRCQCAIAAKDCHVKQTFNKKNCSCECNNLVEKAHCDSKIQRFHQQHVWDAKTCSCSCLRESPCTTGTFWDKTRCRCSKKTEENG